MKAKKLINVEQNTIDKLMEKYPDTTFTRLVDMGLDLLLSEVEDPTALKNIQSLVLDYNKLKKSYREFKDEVDNRLISIETKLK